MKNEKEVIVASTSVTYQGWRGELVISGNPIDDSITIYSSAGFETTMQELTEILEDFKQKNVQINKKSI